jgi:hypothetical protein
MAQSVSPEPGSPPPAIPTRHETCCILKGGRPFTTAFGEFLERSPS